MKSIEKKSKRYREIFKGMDQSRSYKIDEAVKLIKDKSKTKFVESIDLSVNLNIKKEKSDQTLRTTVDLPHGNGKKLKLLLYVQMRKLMKQNYLVQINLVQTIWSMKLIMVK